MCWKKENWALLFPRPKVTQMVYCRELSIGGVICVERTVRQTRKYFPLEGYYTLKSARQQPMTAVMCNADFINQRLVHGGKSELSKYIPSSIKICIICYDRRCE